MGFSLGRALAGAIAGGAGAAADLADKQIAEATRQREMDAQMQRQRQLMIEQDQLAGNRAQRVLDMKEEKDIAKRKEIGGFMKLEAAKLRSEGVDPGSAAGLRRLATVAAEAGYDDHSTKYFHNANEQERIANDRESNKEKIAARLQQAALVRQARSDTAAEKADLAEEMKRRQQIEALSRFQIKDDQGNWKTFNGDKHLVGIYGLAIDNGLSKRDAMSLTTSAALKAQQLMLQPTKPGTPPIDPLAALDDAYMTATKQWAKPAAAKGAPLNVPPPPTTTAPEKKVTPGIFDVKPVGPYDEDTGTTGGFGDSAPAF